MKEIKINKTLKCPICGAPIKEFPNWRKNYEDMLTLFVCTKCDWTYG